MKEHDLTDAEQELLDRLPGPPIVATNRITNVWIVEWLQLNEKRTGRLLHEWMEDRRPGWSAYTSCNNKAQVIAAIGRARECAQQTGMIPVLHLEAHGGDTGLAGPNGAGGQEMLRWEELTAPLQQLNLVTRCNLVVVVAACTGFAGIKAFHQGPRAPAVALVGPDAEVTESSLLLGTKEFYRRLTDNEPTLNDMVESASREIMPVAFEPEPFALLAFEALMKHLIISRRPGVKRRRIEMLRQRMLTEGKLADAQIERRLTELPVFSSPSEMQRVWDEMFMIDLYPSNRDRFGVDMGAVMKMIAEG